MAGSTLVVNEALSFLTVHFDKLGRDSLFSMLSEFYFLEETTLFFYKNLVYKNNKFILNLLYISLCRRTSG